MGIFWMKKLSFALESKDIYVFILDPENEYFWTIPTKTFYCAKVLFIISLLNVKMKYDKLP